MTPENAVWVTASISVASLLVSSGALFFSYRNKRADLEQAFVRQRNDINLALAVHKVTGPFAVLLKIADQELNAYMPKVCLLFMHLNLLNDVFQHRSFTSDAVFQSYETWARRILSPWIQSDTHLLDSLKLIYATDDLMPKDFMIWLKDRIPAT